uniref:Putative ovule protein n=1 Tax=Solanum chacoense TaxID=4108 RepID=A0A0V0HGY0_SOLCH
MIVRGHISPFPVVIFTNIFQSTNLFKFIGNSVMNLVSYLRKLEIRGSKSEFPLFFFKKISFQV